MCVFSLGLVRRWPGEWVCWLSALLGAGQWVSGSEKVGPALPSRPITSDYGDASSPRLTWPLFVARL